MKKEKRIKIKKTLRFGEFFDDIGKLFWKSGMVKKWKNGYVLSCQFLLY